MKLLSAASCHVAWDAAFNGVWLRFEASALTLLSLRLMKTRLRCANQTNDPPRYLLVPSSQWWAVCRPRLPTAQVNSVSWTGLIFVKCWNGYMLLKRVPHTAEQPNQQVSLFSYFVVVVAVWSVNCTQPFLMVNSGQKNVFPWGHGNHRETRYDTDDLLMKSSSFHTRTLRTLSGVKQPNLAPWWVLFRSLVMMLFRSHQTMDYNHIANSTVAWTCNSRWFGWNVFT